MQQHAKPKCLQHHCFDTIECYSHTCKPAGCQTMPATSQASQCSEPCVPMGALPDLQLNTSQ
eukprot:5205125-Lingulodinium_polyedra.AAC.1